MITLACLLFWLAFYQPQYTVDFPIVVRPLPFGTLAVSVYGPGIIGYTDRPYVALDIDQLNALADSGYGPWDRVAIGACAIAHERVHMHRKDHNEAPAYHAGIDCLHGFADAVYPTRRILEIERQWEARLALENGAPDNE